MTPFQLLSLQELVALELPPRRWVIEDLVPAQALTRFGAREKGGKSLMTIDMACSVVLAEPFAGLGVTPGPAALFPLEEYIGEVRTRIETRLEPDFDVATADHAPLYVFPSDDPDAGGFRLESPTAIARLDATIAAYGLDLLFIDTLREAHGKKEDSADEMAPVIKPVRRLAHKTGCAIVLVHHFNKQGTSRGSTAIDAAMDQLISFHPAEDAATLAGTLEVKGRYGPKLDLGVQLEAGLRWERSTLAKVGKTAAREAILAALATAPGPLDAKAIAQTTGVKEATVRNALTALVKERPSPVISIGGGTRSDPRMFALADEAA
jgi:hypothetical protein